ncbi:sirohydrochlorin chelatase [Aestuariimicrobium kwangyangense]|uniref:sirohydrochlorin chelatase n=1 Tax=Aestuariimicrobium kwangyangense TaxID=396389 RepID=UPI0003B46950|nr:CbiX/SirB N-terminal domain-containing protein [Aestuariimicrobium kwangyangense]
MSRPIVVAAHGTRSQLGQRTITRAAELLASATGAAVTVGWIDVLEPTVDEVVAGLDSPVVVPWLVGGGFHLLVDVKRAAAANPGATVLAPVGDSPGLVDALVERLGDQASDAATPVALLWAGSRMPVAQERVAEIARRLGERVGRPVTPVALAASAVPADEAVSALREGSDEPAAVSLLLAPGYFHDLAREVAAVTHPIGTHPALIAAVARDYAHLDD